MSRTYKFLWILDYMDDIEADFYAIYNIPDWEELDGPRFIRLVERLPLYKGAVQGRLRIESQDKPTTQTSTYQGTPELGTGQSIPMSQAVSGDAQLRALNEESMKYGGGQLFEMTTG